MKSGAELKVGAVVLAALVVLGLVLYYFIGVLAARMGYPLEVVFDRGDVRPGDGVAMAGVSVGRVESVGLYEGNRALVRLRINRGVEVRRGYSIAVVPAALLGEKYVEITPVPKSEAGPPLAPGARVQGQPSVRIEDLLADTQKLLGGLTRAMDAVTELVQDQQVRGLVEQSLASVNQAAHNMGQLAQALSGMAAQARPQVRAVLANVEGVTRDLRATSRVLARAASETEIPAELEETVRLMRSTVERVDAITAQLQEIVTAPAMQDFVVSAVRDLRDTSANIRQASDDLRTAAAAIQQGARDVPEITANAREASANIRDASVEVKEITREARSGLSRVTGGAAGAARVIRGLPQISAELNLGAQYLTRADRWSVDANLDLLNQNHLLRLGAADIGEGDRFNFQLGQPLGPGRLRYGVVESEVGLGYDWPVTPRLTLSGEAFDPNDLRANLFGYWGLGGTLEGWNVVVGYRGAGGGGSPAVGIRRER